MTDKVERDEIDQEIQEALDEIEKKNQAIQRRCHAALDRWQLL